MGLERSGLIFRGIILAPVWGAGGEPSLQVVQRPGEGKGLNPDTWGSIRKTKRTTVMIVI